jgi:hypothetical protein
VVGGGVSATSALEKLLGFFLYIDDVDKLIVLGSRGCIFQFSQTTARSIKKTTLYSERSVALYIDDVDKLRVLGSRGCIFQFSRKG